MNTRLTDHIKHLGVPELLAHMESHPLDTTKNSRELISDYARTFQCFIPTATVVIAALLANHAVVPAPNEEVFRFVRMDE